MRVVFDTNILVAAFVAEGLCHKLLRRAREGRFSLILCPFILDEFERKLREKFSATPDEIRRAMRLVEEASSEIVHPSEEVKGVCRDSDDDPVLSCVSHSEADYLVSGDDDLLCLGSFDMTKVISPRAFELLFAD